MNQPIKTGRKLGGCGHCGVDLQGKISRLNGKVRVVEKKEAVLPVYLCAQNHTGFYFGKIKAEGNEREVTIPIGGNKSDLEFLKFFSSRWALEDHLDEQNIDRESVLDFKADVVLGQGALNSIFAATIYARGARRDIEPYLLSFSESGGVRSMLPIELRNGRYRGFSNSESLTNITITGLAEKLNFRRDLNSGSRRKEGVESFFETFNNEDGIFLNSVKSPEYAEFLLKVIRERNPDAYLFATDSMVDKLGREVILDNLDLFRVYSSKVDEMHGLLGTVQYRGIDRSSSAFKGALIYGAATLQSRMKPGARVYLTDDARGSYVLDESGAVYFHPVARGLSVVNTTGCGDAFAGVLAYRELENCYSAVQNLKAANIAGQIKVGLEAPCCEEMATPAMIQEFLREHKGVGEVFRIY